jgi:hypothetical protein
MSLPVVALVLTACPGIDESGRPPREHGVAQDWVDIRETFDRYKDALKERDGEAAAGLISTETLDYYEEMRQVAARAGPAEIRKHSLMNRLLITRMRIGIHLPALRSMTGREVFALGVKEGWSDAENTSRQEFGEIDVVGDFANAAQTNGVPTSYDFHREQGQWKLDLTAVIASANFAFKQAARESGQSENQFLFTLLESATGRSVTKAIWRKPR